ncbi:unnamed protein product [Paramecium pentaurelia]|uniref:Anoctamin transmembrane domain-containing protein n=1 Tax=Paramecium pentaurelia TaxID=43138 RepID=A0A8S1XXF1_9CILI|nr:unnamed protein product [Paramecium pentaurelia]
MINIEFNKPEQKRQQILRTKGMEMRISSKKKQKVQEKKQQQKGNEQQNEKLPTIPQQEMSQIPEQEQQLTDHLQKPQNEQKGLIKLSTEQQRALEFAKLVLNLADPAEYTDAKPIIKKKQDFTVDPEEEEQEEKIDRTDFLSTAEYQELLDVYSDYNIGELVLKFPNPDWEKMVDRPVDIKEADKVFSSQLAISAEGGVPQSQLTIQRQVFLSTYLQLADYVETDKKKLKETLKKTQTGGTLKDNPDYLNYIAFFEQYRQVKDQSVEELLRKDEPLQRSPSEEINQEVIQMMNLIHLKPNENLDIFQNINKKYCKGGFLYKKWTDDKTDYDWIQVGQTPQDFLTLIRMTVITKLCRDAHFHCRQFISSDDQFIFVVLKSKLEYVRYQAELQRMQKQYELGYADILSLEPCDKLLRPLRLKNYLRDPDFVKEAPNYLEEKKEDPNQKKKLARIDSEAQKIYQGVLKWGDQELRANCVKKQQDLDPLIQWMAVELKINLSSEKTQIADDQPLSRDVWEAYHIYQLYLIDYLKRVQESYKEKEVKANKGFLFKLIFRKAIGDPNELYQAFNNSWFKEKLILANLWDRQGLDPIAPYQEYFVTKPNEGLWRQYEVSEKGHRSEFMNMEKIKIAYATISRFLNIKKMIENEYINCYFALHDPYQLMGLSKAPMIKPLIDLQLVREVQKSPGELKLNNLFVSLKDEAERADFDSDCLVQECKFQWCPPWTLPIDSMRDYFGEKIGLYFRFLQFYSQQLWQVVILAIVCEGVIDNTTGDVKKAFIVIFAVILISWSSYFICHWKRQQTMFQIQFGQNDQSEGGEIERPAFEGDFVRSLITDQLNEEYYPIWKKQFKLFYSSFVTLIIISMVIASVIGVFILKNYLIEEYPNDQFLVSFVPSMINAIVIQLFNLIYFNVSNNLNDFENHKYEQSYEDSLILKTYIFTFINTFNCLAIIAFLNEQFPALSLCKTSDGINCYRALKDQMVTIFMVNFAKTLPQLITPCIKAFIRGKTKQVDENLVTHEFNQIDEFIESQANLEPYVSNAEVDGLMNDYMELVVQFAFLQLFGLAFPLSYFIAFLTNLTQIQVDKLKLIHFIQRPIPSSAANIANWSFIMDVIAFLSVFCNAGLIVFTSGVVPPDSQSSSYAIFVIVFLGLKYFSSFIISPVPEKASLILTRHKFAVDRVQRGMRDQIKSYYNGRLRENIDGVDYEKMQEQEKEHLLKGPNVNVELRKT